MPAAVSSAFDVAYWFADTALNDNEYLQPQKLHRLLFLAQAFFAVAYKGRRLMPGTFVADEMGPLEPNLFVAMSKGRPDLDVDLFLPEEVETFLDRIWRRFGHMTVDSLNRICRNSSAYKRAYAKGKRAVIPLDAMRLSFARGESAPTVAKVAGDKVRRTQTGRPVKITAWRPPSHDGS
ncbi:MAG: hypothetical protein KDE22_17085 [Rhodobacterales bacterium]|nr:hypothetical protein [Rhodobacterales bacterium]